MKNKYLVHKNSCKVYRRDNNGMYLPFLMGYQGNITYDNLIEQGFESIEEKDLPQYLDQLFKDLTNILFSRKRK